ncbi:protocadherin-16-like [Liolophura sinensis]|uniref:protocadherin-16-like n=1 Tax=Liolophura sinensis TaxID=3198878 RepID=UPI0031591EDA
MSQNYYSNVTLRIPLASDPDVGDTIHYSISKNAMDVFHIDPLTGVITTREGCNDSCDRSQDCHLIMFTVWAINPDKPSLNASMNVNVSLLTPSSPGQTTDLMSCDSVGIRNKNAPKFVQEFYGKSYSESVTPGTVVVYVSAVDGDPGPEGEIDYFLRGTADFDINAQGGISTLRNMDSQRPGIVPCACWPWHGIEGLLTGKVRLLCASTSMRATTTVRDLRRSVTSPLS